jgi:diguanylate cyclase (GGDEF)-like protein
VEIGRRLAEVTRNSDGLERGRSAMAGRFGGDEFVVVLDRIHAPDDAVRVAERVLRVMSRPFRASGRSLRVRCSIGVSTSVRDYDSMDTLIRDADLAMYRAKMVGRGRYVVFDESMRLLENLASPVFSAQPRGFRVG